MFKDIHKMARFIGFLKKTVRIILMAVYAPVYTAAYALQKLARVLLAVAYFGLFEFRTGWDILRFMFGTGIKANDGE